ncbi:WecB/TagA/CpsF family glycosyltransferase [Oceanobacillus sp. CAU 1775]
MEKALNTVEIMDVDFVNLTKKDFLQHYLSPRLIEQKKTFLVTANPEIVMYARENESYKSILQSADYVVPDGIGIVIASKIKKQPLQERIAGFELMLDLLDHAEEKNLSCYFLGATEEVNAKVIAEVKKKHPELIIAGRHHGFFELEDEAVKKEVLAANPDIIFAALGFPKQEEWITMMLDECEKGLFIGVGGSFDVLAGEVKRAPEAWIKLNLEWLYRIIEQPFRAKRILKAFEFMIRILFKKY